MRRYVLFAVAGAAAYAAYRAYVVYPLYAGGVGGVSQVQATIGNAIQPTPGLGLSAAAGLLVAYLSKGA